MLLCSTMTPRPRFSIWRCACAGNAIDTTTTIADKRRDATDRKSNFMGNRTSETYTKTGKNLFTRTGDARHQPPRGHEHDQRRNGPHTGTLEPRVLLQHK